MNFFREISCEIEKTLFHEKIKIHPKYGKGSVDIYNLNPHVSMMSTDVNYKNTISIDYNMPSGFLEMNACFNGMILNKPRNRDERVLNNKELSIFQSNNKSHENSGTMIFPENTYLQSFCFAMDGDFSSQLFREGVYPFEESNSASTKLQNKVPELSFILHQMKNQHIAESFLPMYMESKMIEAMAVLSSAMLTSKETTITNQDIVQIHKIPQMLRDNMKTPPTIEIISKSLAMNRQKLQQLFQEEFGETLYAYHKRLRLNHAMMLLTDTTQTIEQISYDIGYSNPSYFSYTFKLETGITPNEYRKCQKENILQISI